MTIDSPDLVIAKRLLDHVKAQGFQFQRVAEDPDGALLGTRRTDEWIDTVYLDGFSRGCYALREHRTSLVVPGSGLVERHAAGGALNVLSTVLNWETRDPRKLGDRPGGERTFNVEDGRVSAR